MATLLAPYNTAMQLGTGFNSFTQQICINNAVTAAKEAESSPKCSPEECTGREAEPKRPVAQEVVYKTSIIDKVTDVTNEMNINAAFAIKYDAFDAKGKIGFLNTSKVKESDVTFLITVKVVNQVIHDHSLTQFQPIEGVEAKDFTDVYGDCFVSGFQEGGTFTAVISVKANNEAKAKEIKAQAAVRFTKEKEIAEDGEAKGHDVNGDLDIDFRKNDLSFLQNNETTISVSYTGGGQHLKQPGEDWTFETMRNAALKFPDLVAKTPMRTHAILTKYTALRSYHARFAGLKMPAFEMAGVYSNILQEAYLDYKTVAKNLQVLAFEVSAGAQTLITATEARQQLEERRRATLAKKEGKEVTKEITDGSTITPLSREVSTPRARQSASAGTRSPDSGVESSQNESGPYIWKPLTVEEDFSPTLQGVEMANRMVRMFLIRIVQEINILSKFPEAAMDENRIQPHMNPFLFKEFLPVGVPVETPSEIDNALDPVEKQLESLKKMQGRT